MHIPAPILALVAALIAVSPALAQAPAPTVTVTVAVDASLTAPSDHAPFTRACTVTLPVLDANAPPTAGQAVDAAEAQGCFDVEYDVFSFGRFVSSVDGLAAQSYDPSGLWLAGRYWAVYFNCEYAQVGIDAYELQEGDVIQLNYELSLAWSVQPNNPATLAGCNGLSAPTTAPGA